VSGRENAKKLAMVAVHLHAVIKGDPFVGFGRSYETALIHFCIALLFLLLGLGRYSVNALIFGKTSGSSQSSS
jgi:putative oxidoreductase